MSVFLREATSDVDFSGKVSLRVALLFPVPARASLPCSLSGRSALALVTELWKHKSDLDKEQHSGVSEVQAADIEKGGLFAHELSLPLLVLLRVQSDLGRVAQSKQERMSSEEQFEA